MSAPAEEARSLVDTNILVYAYDLDDPTKHPVALELIDRLSRQGRLVLSSQAFNEFCSVMMRANRPGRLNADQLSSVLRDLESIAEVVPVTPAMTFRALGALKHHGLSFWDALIWEAAENGIPVIYTEDYQHGRVVEGVQFLDPFVVNQAPTA